MATKLNILLVEDDELDAMNVQRALRDSDAINPLTIASDGIAALELLRGGTLSLERLLVVLDLNMPRMNGLELLRELRRDEALRTLPVVVLTTSDEDSDKLRAFDLNVAGYVLKPVTFQAFAECIRTLERYWSLVEFP